MTALAYDLDANNLSNYELTSVTFPGGTIFALSGDRKPARGTVITLY